MIENFVWKGEKVKDQYGKYQQTEKRLIDMTESELKKCYDHCKTMLFNYDINNPGRYTVLGEISDQKTRCGVELFLRYLSIEKNLERFNLINELNKFSENNKEYIQQHKVTSTNIFSSLPNEFLDLPLNLLIDGCLDRLGAFSKKHITKSFILRQGVWLTSQEIKDLNQDNPLNPEQIKNILEVIRERLDLKEIDKLYINSKGLNYTQLRGMIQLKNNKKYSELSTNQLETLRYRVLFTLEEDVRAHIVAWEKRMEQIEEVAENLNYKL